MPMVPFEALPDESRLWVFAVERTLMEVQEKLDGLVASAERSGFDVSKELKELRKKLDALKESTYMNLTPMEQVQVARHPERPFTLDYIERIFTDWLELHGDRHFRDDEAIVGGWGRLRGRSVMIVGQQKGRDMKENLRRNFGMAHPEGYRKALRLMRQAEKFGRPVISFIAQTMASSGFEITITIASGECALMPSATVRMMPRLVLSRSSRLMPGLRGRPAVTR